MADITTVQIPLLANAILEKENKEKKTMSKEQRCIAKWIDKDGNTINFERFSTSNIKKIENDCIELNADTLIASKDTLSNFDYFKVFETEPDGTNEKLMLTIPAHLYLEKIANFYKKKHEHFPYEDEFDAARWKNITDKRAERMGITELTIWEKLNKEAKTNYVLDKLSKAGIEVVTDKEEFDRILGQEDRLQKMAGKSPKWLTVDDVKTLSSFGYKNFDEIRQIQEAILVSSYKLNDKKTTFNKAVEILGRQEFLRSIARSAFHWTSGNTKDGNYVHFDSSILFSRDKEYRQNREKLEQAYRESKEHIGILNDILTKESYFTFNKEDAKHFNEQIDDWEKDNSNPQKLIIVGNIPPVMKILGISDRLIEVEHSTLDKMIRDYPLYPDDKQGHKLNIDAIRSIPSELANPVMVFKSKTRADSYVFFTERKDSENRSILIPLAVDKRKGRIIINEITSMYGKDNEIDFVKSNFDEDKLLYIDKERADKWNKEWDLKTKSSNGELVTKIQFLGQRITDIETYIPNILTKERLVNFISGRDQNEYLQKMTAGENTYGFIHNGKIYLNPEIMNSNAVVHEYTHLWDAYTQKTNPELWNKGLEVFKNTSLWNDVINDENYSDIKNNENLVLSECHARLCGKIADEVLQKVLERDGDLKKTDMINWDNETWEYIGVEFRTAAIKVLEAETKEFSFNNTKEFLEQFLSTPMKDLFQKELNMKLEKTYTNNHNLHNKKQANSIELTSDDLKNAKALLPKEQYQLVLSYTQGEEAEHFKGIIKEISAKAEKIKGKGEILTEDEKHPLAFKYTLGNSRFYFSEWDGNDELFGYAVLNNDTQNSEWGYTSLEELKNAGERDSNVFPVLPEMTFYGLEETIEKQISIDYPELSEKMGFSHKKNHNEELISEFGKEILETLDNRKLEHSAYNICCAAQFVLRSMDSSEKKEVFSIMEKCGCQGKYIKENTEDFLTEVINAESKTASAIYSRNRLYERINKACSTKKIEANKGIQNPESDYDMEI